MRQLSCFTLPTVLAFSALPLTATADPSVDCSKADGQVEQAICQTPNLQRLDNKLHEVYQAAIKQTSGEEKSLMQAFHQTWIKARNNCWKSDKLGQCVENNYKTHIAQLQIQAGKVTVPAPMTYQCKTQNLMVYFYNDTEVPVAVINELNPTTPDQQIYAFISQSASGGKYEAHNLTFWTKGDEATLIRYGKPDEVCQVKR
ncbi:MAG: MliC family protein [Shewanella sp.]|nr:MliC family protein [Shewanella sp.]MCF1431730.1 MliC family protein [Shewanella sp.]MCF1458537.1 MliC family protein [Shewanella sp.]